jgi:hypothetical protein
MTEDRKMNEHTMDRLESDSTILTGLLATLDDHHDTLDSAQKRSLIAAARKIARGVERDLAEFHWESDYARHL